MAVIPLQTAGAQEQLASDADIEEMAGALGYSGSKDPGFWEALAQAVADQRAAAQERTDSEHAKQFQQAWADAAKYGRRLEETHGRITLFTELIPPTDGDIEQGEILVRTGEEFAELDGTRTVVTTYWKHGEQVGVVASVVDDGVETVTQVIEYKPDSIDVKVGDERPVPAPGSSAAGLKPHTIDPKADGSLGRASGGLPDGGDKAEPAPLETVVRDTAGTRWWFDPIKLPDGRVITPFIEERPPASPDDLAYRTGYIVEHPDWGGAVAEITAYFDVEGKIAGVVGSVIQGGTDTIVAVEEVTPGSLGLKKGDSRQRGEELLKSNKPSAWEPKPQSSGGSTTTGGTEPTGGTQPTGDSTSQDASDPKQDPEPAPDDNTTDPAPSSSTTTTTSSGDSHPQYVFLGVGPVRQNDDGSTSQNTLYQRTSDGVYVQTITTTQKDGSQSEEQHCYKDSQEVDCGGLTDEPTCQVDCERVAMLSALFACASGPVGAECGQPPEGLQQNLLANPNCPSNDPNAVATTAPSYGDGHVHMSGCENADKPGGPLDYGDSTDPNGAEPVDTSQIDRLGNDGVTDPVNPGEPEEIAAGSGELDTYDTLRDPVNPPGTEDEAPAPGVPTTGDTENPAP